MGIFVERLAGLRQRCSTGTKHLFGKMLARIYRQIAHRHKLSGSGVPGTGRRMHAAGLRHRTLEYPVWQRCLAQCLAGVDIRFHHVGDFEPASLLPQLERTLLHAKAPAHAEVDIAGVVGN